MNHIEKLEQAIARLDAELRDLKPLCDRLSEYRAEVETLVEVFKSLEEETKERFRELGQLQGELLALHRNIVDSALEQDEAGEEWKRGSSDEDD